MGDWSYMKSKDAISGTEGALYAIIDGNVSQVAECKAISAKITKKKSEFRALGYRGTQNKATGWAGTGSLTIHYASSRWSKMMIDYAKTGVDTYFKLQVVNEDPTSAIGKQTVTLLDVNFDDAEIAKLDTGADFLDQSMSFTFSGVEMVDEFNDINQ